MSQASIDCEYASTKLEYPNGFSSLASLIAKDPEHSFAIYRRFAKLSGRNLLYLQAKLQKLEAIQISFDQEDLLSTEEQVKQAATSWEDFESLARTNAYAEKRMRLAEDVQTALRNYQEALLLSSQISELKRPLDSTLRAFKSEFEPVPGQTQLRGHSARFLDDATDLVALHAPVSEDRLTHLVLRYIPWFFVTGSVDNRIAHISHRRLTGFVSVLSTLLAAFLLIGAIISLHKERNPDARVALVAVFTVLFAGSVALLTTNSRAEVFAATAAYCAVLVVFVSGNVGGFG
ncbi:MAG: hypothetical protein M1828_005425 [Chrysothrix sp. TS-e1954]|nr:MAG: hypothetical protein M1828_005425 [Chrysothrix sp. TS-e1954]